MFKSCAVLILSLVVVAMLSTTIHAQDEAMAGPVIESNTPGGAITYGVKGGDDYIEQQLDMMIPLYLYDERGMFFVNPRASYNDNSEKELNFGAGYRHLLSDKNLILGGNMYYDSRWPNSDAQFDQMGVGIELMSTWIDARANYYLPEDKEVLVESEENVTQVGSSQTATYSQWAEDDTIYESSHITTINTFMHEQFDIYEGTLEGWDAEIGIRIPMPWENLETRIFAGYYSFDPNIEVARVEGWKGRLEIRALPAILLDAEFFEDDSLFGVDYLVGARMQVPFNIGNAFSGENPFAGFVDAFKSTKQEFKQRLFTDQVMRDPHIQVRRHVEQTLSLFDEIFTSKKTVSLYSGVIFVDDSNISGIETGTLENPFDTIAEGLAAQQANGMVFVFGGNYNESVTIVRNVMLIGEGFRLGRGRGFGSGEYAVLTGQGGTAGTVGALDWSGGQGAAIRVRGAQGANDVIIRGFDINNTGWFGGGILGITASAGLPSPSGLNDFVKDATGVLVENVASFEFSGNVVRNTPLGVVQWHQDMPSFVSDIHHNAFLANGAAVVDVAVDSSGGSRISNNLMAGNMAGVIAADLRIASPVPVAVGHDISGNVIIGGGHDALLNGMMPGGLLPTGAGISIAKPAPMEFPPFGAIGILGLTVGEMSSGFRIEDNLIGKNLIGLAGIEALGGTATYGISRNDFVDNAIGTALIAIDGAALNFVLEDNVYKGGLLSDLAKPLLPPDITIPDMDLMAVFVGSFSLGGTPTAINGVMSGNYMTDHIFGIGALAAGPNASMNLAIEDNYLRGSGLGVLGNIPAKDVAKFLTLNPGVTHALNDLGLPPVATMIEGNYGIAGIGLGSIFGAEATVTINHNLIENFALNTAAAAWTSGTIGLTVTDNLSNSDGKWWAGNGGSVNPLNVAGNNFTFTEYTP